MSFCTGESLEDFLERLKALSINCNFVDSTSAIIKEAAIRDAFISGMISGHIRQRILEDNVLSLNDVFDKARRLDEARKHANSYDLEQNYLNGSRPRENVVAPILSPENFEECSALTRSFCSYCGSSHKRGNCPAYKRQCYKCG